MLPALSDYGNLLHGDVLDRVGIYRQYDHDGGFFDWAVQEVQGVCLHTDSSGSVSGAEDGHVPQSNRHICTGVWWRRPVRGDVVFLKTREVR